MGRAVRTDTGFLRAPARLTRVGVFEYRQADGSVSRELRLPEEVFNEDSLNSFAMAPLTDDHPYAQGGLVTAENAKQLAVGSVGEPKQDGDFVVSEILVTDAKVIDKVVEGKAQELSCGYYCDRELAPEGSVWLDSGGRKWPYTHIQRNIRGNHVALVARGRAGPDVRVQLDSETAFQVDSEVEETPKPVVEEVPTMETVQNNDGEIVTLKADLDKACARADSAEAKVKELEAALVVANDPARIAEAVKTRVALETKARSAVADLNMDGLSDAEVKRAVVAKLNDGVKLDGKSDEYVSAAFELLTEGHLALKNPATEAAKAAVESTPDVKTDTRNPADNFRDWFFSVKK